MNRHLQRLSLALAAACVSFAVHGQAANPLLDRAAVENIVKEYLLKNPALIRDAMAALQAQEEAEREQLVAGALKSFRAELDAETDAPVGGNPKGDVTVVEFYDYNCGYCKKVAPVLTALLKRDPGVRVIYKEYPILSPQSMVAAKAALAAQRQGKFVAMHEALMLAPGTDEATVKALSVQIGLDHDRLQKDMQDPLLERAIRRNHGQAGAMNINGTPAFIIGERLIPGAASLEQLLDLVKIERDRQLSAALPLKKD